MIVFLSPKSSIGHIDYIGVGDGCWTRNVLVTSSRVWWSIYYIEKITNITKKVSNLIIQSPTSLIGHHHKVTNITGHIPKLSSNFGFGRQLLWPLTKNVRNSYLFWFFVLKIIRFLNFGRKNLFILVSVQAWYSHPFQF